MKLNNGQQRTNERTKNWKKCVQRMDAHRTQMQCVNFHHMKHRNQPATISAMIFSFHPFTVLGAILFHFCCAYVVLTGIYRSVCWCQQFSAHTHNGAWLLWRKIFGVDCVCCFHQFQKKFSALRSAFWILFHFRFAHRFHSFFCHLTGKCCNRTRQ